MEKTFDTLQEMLYQSIEKHSKRDCLSFVDETPLSYADFGKEVFKLSSALIESGIKKGDKIAILSHNMPNWGVAYFATLNVGGITVPLMPDFSETEIENIVEHSEAKAVFVSDRLASKLNNCNISKEITVTNIDRLDVFSNQFPTTKEVSFDKVLPSDIATIVYTSGTTGKSKGVVLTHENLVEEIIMVSHLQLVTYTDVYLSLLPLSHTYECSLGLLTNIMAGSSTFYLQKPPTPSILLPALKKVKPTMILSVPLIIEKIFKNTILPKFTATPLLRSLYKIPFFRKLMHRKACNELVKVFGGNIKFFGIGGAKLSQQVEQFLIEGKSFPYAIGYGLTETAPLIAGVNPSMVKIGSTGPALRGVQLKIHDPKPQTGEGEIWVKGANVMQGYYKEEEITKTVFEDGWFKTGDLGVIDKNGFLSIKGRLKNVIIGASGENIYPEDIESVINSHKLVNESIVIEEKGNLVAMVQLNKEELEKLYKHWKEEWSEKTDKMMIELKEYVNSKVNKFSKIHSVTTVTFDLERTATQKVKRFKYTKTDN